MSIYKNYVTICGTLGISLSAAELYHARGYHVVITGRGVVRGQKNTENIGNRVTGLALDLAEEGAYAPLLIA